MTIKETARHMQ